MSDPRVAHCIFCDDIRLEQGNKISLMGCYGADISIDRPFPLTLPKFGFAVWLISDADDLPERMSVSVILPDGSELLKSTPAELLPPAEKLEGVKKVKFNAAFPVAPLPLPSDGYLEVWVETERERLRAGRLLVRSSAVGALTFPTPVPPRS